MSTVKIRGALQTPKHVRALLSGGLGVFSSLLTIGWALWAYNLPSAVNLTSSQSQNLMLAQLILAFIMLLGSGLMLARFTLPGGIINILGALSTFLIGVYFSSGVEIGRASCRERVQSSSGVVCCRHRFQLL